MPTKSYIRTFLENLDDVVFIMDYPSFKFFYISPSIESRGYTPAEVYANPGIMYQGVDKTMQARMLQQLHENINKGPQHFEYPMKNRAGEERWYSSSTFLVNRSPDKQMLAGIIRDITKQKNTEAALEQLSSKHEDFYNNAPNGYHSLDENGIIVRVNDMELKWLGYSREEMIGKHFADMALTKESQETFKVNFPKLKKEGFLKELQLEVVRKDGSIFPCLVNATIFKDELTGKFLTRSILTDITEIKNRKAKLRQSQQELQVSNEALLEANKKLDRLNFTKDVLLKIVSHDLRNPILTVNMISELLKEKYDRLDDETILKYLDYIKESGQQANHILTNMVGMISLEDNSIRFHFVKASLEPIIQEAMNINLKRASDKGIKLYFEETQDLHECQVTVDASWLVRAIDNLIFNAIKFSKEGGEIKIKCHLSEGKVVTQVSDTGIGIPQDILQSLFKKLAVQSRNGTNGEPGTGLGLLIVKQILDIQGGEITVESAVGEGSIFKIRLPMAIA